MEAHESESVRMRGHTSGLKPFVFAAAMRPEAKASGYLEADRIRRSDGSGQRGRIDHDSEPVGRFSSLPVSGGMSELV
jgi:hypothetical protein